MTKGFKIARASQWRIGYYIAQFNNKKLPNNFILKKIQKKQVEIV
jgi:hypothetical protein